MIERVVALASLVPFAIGALAGPATQARSSVEFAFADPAITESSGLVVRDGLFVTVNDSGDSGRVFAVDADGETVGTTSWPDAMTDVEALAPAGDGEVWVGDIGDNTASRDSVRVLRVPFGRGDRTVTPASYELVYPDGAHDAETLLAQPRTGQLFIVTKGVFGGTTYAAPRRLSVDHPNRLRKVADAIGIATDGSFFPDGRHYVVRNYSAATIYTFPGHDKLVSLDLPVQNQGEGISVALDGSVHVSSEGQFSKVLRVAVPAKVSRLMEPGASASPTPDPSDDWMPTYSGDGGGVWFVGGLLIVGLIVVGGLALAVFVVLVVWLLLRRGKAS